MLVLTRKSNESVIIGNNVEIKVIEVHGDQVRLGFSAPREVAIHRKEVYDTIRDENTQAANSGQDMQKLKDTLLHHFPDNRSKQHSETECAKSFLTEEVPIA